MNTEGTGTIDTVKIMKARGVNHMEAYCIMIYQCSCHHIELVWNSRDGVTPFFITCPKCNQTDMKHIAWGVDLYSPKHVPEKGQLVFINLTKQRWRTHADEWVDTYWDHPEYPLSNNYATKEEARESKYKQWEWWQPALIKYNDEDLKELNTPPPLGGNPNPSDPRLITKSNVPRGV